MPKSKANRPRRKHQNAARLARKSQPAHPREIMAPVLQFISEATGGKDVHLHLAGNGREISAGAIEPQPPETADLCPQGHPDMAMHWIAGTHPVPCHKCGNIPVFLNPENPDLSVIGITLPDG